MKHTFAKYIVATLVATALSFNVLAADEKEKTITGEGKCAKCALKETKSCQNAVQLKENGKTVTYYLTHNDVSKKFHEHLCTSTKKVKVTGTVKEKEGKMELTPKKIELAKQESSGS